MEEIQKIAEGDGLVAIQRLDDLGVTIKSIKDTIVIILKAFSKDLLELKQAREEAKEIMKKDPSRSPYVGVRRLDDFIYYKNQGRINQIEGSLNEVSGLEQNREIKAFKKQIVTLLNILKNSTVLSIDVAEDQTISLKYETNQSFKL